MLNAWETTFCKNNSGEQQPISRSSRYVDKIISKEKDTNCRLRGTGVVLIGICIREIKGRCIRKITRREQKTISERSCTSRVWKETQLAKQ